MEHFFFEILLSGNRPGRCFSHLQRPPESEWGGFRGEIRGSIFGEKLIEINDFSPPEKPTELVQRPPLKRRVGKAVRDHPRPRLSTFC